MPRKMQRFKSSLLVLMVAVVALAQTASEKPNVDVRRVGARLQCQCGCKDSVATCSMLECHFSKPAKERIAQMQAVGMSDEQIVQAFIRDYGMAVYLAQPNAFGWIVPYASVGFGLVVIFLFLRKAYRKPRPMTDLGEIDTDDPDLAKYKEQIEKDTANLD
jgi:cytochrome c-type biogenesis protein CcmH/NrfF